MKAQGKEFLSKIPDSKMIRPLFLKVRGEVFTP